jgi:cellulose biosynthesis protein BcsQ
MLVRFAEGAPVPADGSDILIEPVQGIATCVIGTAACSPRRQDAKLLADLSAHFDYVIVTGPPTTASFETIELASIADVVLLVLEAEQTRRPVARDLVTQVEYTGAKILGVMLLGRRQHIPQSLYRLLIERRLSAA